MKAHTKPMVSYSSGRLAQTNTRERDLATESLPGNSGKQLSPFPVKSIHPWSLIAHTLQSTRKYSYVPIYCESKL